MTKKASGLRPNLITWLLVVWGVGLLTLFVASSETEMLVRSYLTAQMRWSDALHQTELAVQRSLYSRTPEDREALVQAVAQVDTLRQAFRTLISKASLTEKISAVEAAGIHPFDGTRVVVAGSLFLSFGWADSLLADWESADLQVDDLLSVLNPLLHEEPWDESLRGYLAQRSVLAFGALRVIVINYINLASEGSRTLHTFILWFEILCAALMMTLVVVRFSRWIQRAETSRRALEAEHAKNALTLDLLTDGVLAFDSQGRTIFRNAGAQKWLGPILEHDLSQGEGLLTTIEGQSFDLKRTLDAPDPWIRPVTDLILKLPEADSTSVTLSYAVSREAGQKVLVLRNRQWEVDIGAELEVLAYQDPVTGLPNRRRFLWVVEQKLQALAAQAEPVAAGLLLVNLDFFRMVNDSRGHSAGDALLKLVAMQLWPLVPSDGLLARFGGDEFLLLLDRCSAESLETIGLKVLSTVASTTLEWEGALLSCSATVGAVLVPSFPEGGALELLRRAEVACAMAKDAGRSVVRIYREDDPEAQTRGKDFDRVALIRKALEARHFRLYLQKISPLSPDNVEMHYEVLIRMVDTQGTVIPPGEFIPVAERTGLIRAIDRWVVTETLRLLTAPGARIPSRTVFGINLSGDTVSSPGFFTSLLEWLEVSKVDPTLLCFEVTESAVVRDLENLASGLQRLREFGCTVAIDDFGVGQASFGYLRSLPVDFLKIDGSFVRQMPTVANDQVMVRAMNEVAHIMGKQTIAEFAEDQTTVDLLTTMGIDYVQGYAIARPQPWEKELP